jgi:hypothetical protein
MQLSRVLQYSDIMKLSQALKELKLDDKLFTVVTEVDTKKELDKINEDFFYQIPENKDKHPEYGDQVNVNIDNIMFVYKIKEGEEDD